MPWGMTYVICTMQLNSIVRRTIKEADKDKDNHINLEEFKQVYSICVGKGFKY